jgi:hypothetical protein
MPRRTVWVSDELNQLAETLPSINWSEALANGVRALASCEHQDLACAACGTTTTAGHVAGPALEAFFRSIMVELGANVGQPGYEGAARIVRRIAADHDVPGIAAVAVPRATRAQREARLEVTPLPTEADARRRHPTARPVPTNHPGPQPAPPQEHTA